MVADRQCVLGKLFEEARWDRRRPLAAKLANPALAEIELASGAGDANEQEATLLLQLGVVILRAAVGEEPLFQPDNEDDREFQPFGRVQGHQRAGASLVLPPVDGRGQADFLQERNARGAGVLA